MKTQTAELEQLAIENNDLMSVFIKNPRILDMLLYIIKYNDSGYVKVNALVEKFGSDIAIQNIAELRRFNLIRVIRDKVLITDEGIFQVETLFEIAK